MTRNAIAALSVCLSACVVLAEDQVIQNGDGTIHAGNHVFESWQDYFDSDYFHDHGHRCRTHASKIQNGVAGGGAADCTFSNTNPSSVYDPSVIKYRIPVVFHVIRHSNGTTGHVSETKVHEQIEILNEDFLALTGTNGENGTDIQIEFFLAQTDPSGNPTNGITYSNNTTWFNDGGSYWNTLAWDTARYMNLYSNTASGALGYVPDLPQGGIAGSPSDRVVVLWSTVGRNGPIGPPFNQGRTTTHEVGHYLGLEHTFNGGCASASACYNNGDLICDTNPEANPTDGCSNANSCGSSDPFHNYMDYSDDTCMEEFTPEQARRMRCSLEFYRSDLYLIGETECGNDVVEAGEECDDGNTNPGDGCDENCQFENVCGNDIIEPGEQCDDGNTSPGDGCDENCQNEPVCGNDVVEAGEECEPPNTPTCDANCQRIPICGDNTVDPGEQCDDGNTNPGDGCDQNCQFEAGHVGNCCDTGHGAGCSNQQIQDCVCAQDPFCCQTEWDNFCVDGVEDFGCGSCTPTAQCGNGVIESGEQCDDGDNSGGDGCSAGCSIESGFSCSGQPSVCFPDCNNNGTDDATDLSSGASNDCDKNNRPDECDPDSDNDGVPNVCDVCPGADDTIDEDTDGVPACLDCNDDDDSVYPGNAETTCDGIDNDCNPKTEDDPDSQCPVNPPQVAGEGARYIKVEPANGSIPVAIVVTSPTAACLNQYADFDANPDLASLGIARLTNSPVYRLPAEWGSVLINSEDIVPDHEYEIQLETESGGLVGSPQVVRTFVHGDVNDNGVANFEDVLFVVQGFQGVYTGSHGSVDLAPCYANGFINFEDIQWTVFAFQGEDYEDQCSMPCGQ